MKPSTLRLIGFNTASATAIFMVNLDTTVVNIILPTLADHFDVDMTRISLVNVAYLLSLTAFLLVFGRLSDRWGPEKIFIPGYVLFTVGSALCALSRGIWDLSAYRFVQGVGGSMIFATSAVIIVKYIPAEMRGRAYGVNGLFAGIGFALGSPVGGYLCSFGWQWVFLVNIPIGLVGIFLCLRFLDDRTHVRSRETFDTGGAVLSFFALILLIAAFQAGGKFSWTSPGVLGCFAVSGLLWVAFLVVESRVSNPLVPLSLFRNLPLSAALIANFVYLLLLYGISFIFPFYFKYIQKLTDAQTGHCMALFPLVSIVISPVTGFLCDKIGPRVLCIFSMAVFVASTVLFLRYDAATPTTYLVVTLLLFGLAMALFCTAILTLIMTHAAPGRAGVLSSVKAVIPNLGGLLGVSMFSIVFTHHLLSEGEGLVETASLTTLMTGFRQTMVLALAVAVAGLLASLVARPRENAPAPPDEARSLQL
ncbi:MAG: MFS transporter [Acidobacteria bacterium]|nr:MFS transporter [Acidobacteriota bacterium]